GSWAMAAPAKKDPRQFHDCTYSFAVARRAGREETVAMGPPGAPPEECQYRELMPCGTVLRVASSPSVYASSPVSRRVERETTSPTRWVPCGRMVMGPRSGESIRPVPKIGGNDPPSSARATPPEIRAVTESTAW